MKEKKLWSRRLLRGIAALLLMGVVGMNMSQVVLACKATPGCSAKSGTVTCERVVGHHSVHTVIYPDGYVATCDVATVSGGHILTCACGGVIGSEFRTCAIYHSDDHCYDQFNMCQYWNAEN